MQDPFCGSGTLVIEAAQKALNIAPGLRRRFAAEHYDFVPAAVWAEERQKALAASRLDAGFEGFGFDIDPNAVALANANAKLAGVGDRCRFEVADVKDFAPRPSSIILTNPPYGERLGDAAEAAADNLEEVHATANSDRQEYDDHRFGLVQQSFHLGVQIAQDDTNHQGHQCGHQGH